MSELIRPLCDKTKVLNTDLAMVAPGCHWLLKRTVTTGELAEIAKIFALIIESQGLEHPDIPRKPGASFNPFPARVIQITCSEGQLADFNSITSALLSTKLSGDFSDLSRDLPDQIVESAKGVNLFLSEIESRNCPSELSSQLATIAAAHILDRLRHLHLSQKSLEGQRAEIELLTPKIMLIADRISKQLANRVTFAEQTVRSILEGRANV